MTPGPLPWLLPGIAVALVASVLAGGTVARRLSVSRWAGSLLLLALGVIASATLTPLAGLDEGAHPATCDLSRIGLASLSDIFRPHDGHPSDVALNLLMFVPVGFVIALIPTWRRRAALMAAVLALPFAIEAIQLVATGLNRACESGDVVDNMTGALAGLGLGLLAARFRPALRSGGDGGPAGAESGAQRTQ